MDTLFELIKKSVLIIAEIGCNHNGDISLAKKLIEVAAEGGADVAKFQTFTPEEMITENAPKAIYQIKAIDTKESQFQRLKRMSLSHSEQEELKTFCEQKNIIFSSSPFDHKSAYFLHKMNLPFFKIPSGEITNLPLLEYIGSFGKPIILSTGMANLGEIEDALNSIGKENRKNVILMHCLSDYPAKWEDTNLRAIQTIRSAFHLPVGFSDHTEGIELPLVAVGMGAVVIEKHITLDKNMEGGDHRASLEPNEFKEMVRKIRLLEIALGDGIKRCMPSEENIRDVARKSIVALKNIRRGQIINRDDLSTKRPGTGIPPKFLKVIPGTRAKKDILADHLIQWSQLDL
ncbi:MAG: N-acetylneuraminate synthase [Thermodesulfobacteriota bacterium]